jgi:hypothetical protein
VIDHVTDENARRHTSERRVVWAVVVVLVLFRSLLFVFGSTLSFDADEGVFGLMAKHLAEGRAVPLFMYGQSYILAVEAWMAAPLFLLFGPSIAALKLPLLAVNLAAALLLVHLLERDGGLRPVYALAASLFFIIAAPGTAATLLQASGGNVEPFLYTLLLWILRRRPIMFGLVAGLGFLHREFTIYGIAAIVMIQFVNARTDREDDWRPLLRGLRVAAETWLVVQLLRPFASVAGPGTTMESIAQIPGNHLGELLQRTCMEPATFGRGLVNLIRDWTGLFGTSVVTVDAFGIDTGAVQGVTGLGWLLGGAVIVMAVSVAARVELTAVWWRRHRFFVYLVAIGAASSVMYVVARCGTRSPMRYDLLSILGAIGLTAWFLAVEPRRWLRMAAVAVVVACAAAAAVPHGHMWTEQAMGRPIGAKVLLLRHLDARGIRYAMADYWIAYSLTFLSNERVIVGTADVVRIPAYNREVAAHRAEAVRISRSACGAGSQVMTGIYLCPY